MLSKLSELHGLVQTLSPIRAVWNVVKKIKYGLEIEGIKGKIEADDMLTDVAQKRYRLLIEMGCSETEARENALEYLDKPM